MSTKHLPRRAARKPTIAWELIGRRTFSAWIDGYLVTVEGYDIRARLRIRASHLKPLLDLKTGKPMYRDGKPVMVGADVLNETVHETVAAAKLAAPKVVRAFTQERDGHRQQSMLL